MHITYYVDKQGDVKNDKNKSSSRYIHQALCSLEKHLASDRAKNDDGW